MKDLEDQKIRLRSERSADLEKAKEELVMIKSEFHIFKKKHEDEIREYEFKIATFRQDMNREQ